MVLMQPGTLPMIMLVLQRAALRVLGPCCVPRCTQKSRSLTLASISYTL